MKERLNQILARLAEIGDEMRTIVDTDVEADEAADVEARFQALKAEADTLNTEREDLLARAEALKTVEDAAGDRRNSIEFAAPVVDRSKDVFDVRDVRTSTEFRARAFDVIEAAVGIEDEARESATRLLERAEGLETQDGGMNPERQKGAISRLIVNTMTPEYRRAWVKLMGGRENSLTTDERAAVGRVEEFRAAFGLTQSGYAVPALVDPTVILANSGVIDPMRSVARVESITANSWKPVISGGVTASWDGEIAEVSDDTPTFSQPEITAHKAQAFAQGSIEAVEDWVGIANELGREFADAKMNLEGPAFISGAGDGSNQPFGIITELDGGSSELSPATPETFAVADVYSTIEAVPPRYRRNLSVQAELSTINGMRQFATANNYHAFLTDMSEGNPARLLGYRLLENSSMDALSDLDAGATADNFLLLAGDFSKYVIVDRVGLSVEFIPHLFNTSNNLPDGRRGWYAYWRVGAESIVDDAFRVMSVPTTA